MRSTRTDILKLVASLLICQFAGALGAIFTVRSVQGWYTTLNRPPFAPPSGVFAPVWTTLFVLMGIALFMVWRRAGHPGAPAALRVFAIQWLLNVLWSVAFFGLQSPLLGLIDIVALWGMIVLTIVRFARVSRPAAWLLAPYIAWVSFAIVLNASYWVLNR